MRHVAITGASSGLGAALAARLADGADRLTLFGRDVDRLDAVAARCRSGARHVSAIICDVTNAAGMERCLLEADDAHPIDLVIANAGIGGSAVLSDGAVEPRTLAASIIDINIHGVINSVAPLIERFVARRSGQIAIVGSMAGFEGLAEAPAYSASKAAVRAYGHGLRRRLVPHNVHVTVVTPGFIATPMSASLPYKQPFQWTANRAAARIADGLAQRQAEIIFPWQLRCAVGLASVLPAALVDRMLAAGAAKNDGTEA